MTDGILIIDKPKGMTSHDVVDYIRKRFGIKKAGHGGTLDPMATGVLVILIGGATKLAPKFLNHDKEYDATLTLGVKTDTGDADGKVLEFVPIPEKNEWGNREDIEKVFSEFSGPILQVPPMVSALKYKGRRLYKLARKGIEVPRSPRAVYISKLELTDFHLPQISFRVACSKGTYIRALGEALGIRLGYGGHISALRRIRSGPFTIEEAISPNNLPCELSTVLKRLDGGYTGRL